MAHLLRVSWPQARWVARVVGASAVLALPHAARAQSLLDTSVTPAAYDIATYVQTGSIAISPTNNGHPGPALLAVYTVPSPPTSTDHSYAYLIYRNHVYDPAAQGVVGSIGFSIDKSVVFNPSGVAWGNGQGFLLEQGGRLYESDVGLAAVQGVFQTASATGLSATDFYLLVNPATHQADAGAHPDFSAGPMRFGFFNGAGVPPGAPDLQIQYTFDNFSITVSAVPEPSGALLSIAGLLVVASRRRMATRTHSAAA